MNNSEQLEAILRVVSNRCRNLRKTIDRAKTWEQAADNGLVLNDEQSESIRGLPRKEALLVELQELLKKQTVIAESQPQSSSAPGDQITSKTPARQPKSSDSSKALTRSKIKVSKTSADTDSPQDPSKKAPNGQPGNSPTANDVSSSIESDLQTTDASSTAIAAQSHIARVATDENTAAVEPMHGNVTSPSSMDTSSTNATPTSLLNSSSPTNDPAIIPHSSDPINQSAHALPINSPNAVNDSFKYTKIIQNLEARQLHQLERTKYDSMRHVLNLFHVVDFLRQPGSRETLLAYCSTANPRHEFRSLTSLDMDLLCYFNVMLTSPNGNVPHGDAVDVSTAHCLEFLKSSTSEAFKGTSYATLSEIVRSIASCPILTDRGRPATAQAKPNSRTSMRSKAQHSDRPDHPGQTVEDAKRNAAML